GALRMMARWNLNPLIDALPGIDVPVTLVLGENDKTVPPETTRTQAGRLPRADLIEVPRLGHLMHEEEPTRFVDLALERLGQGD
ncbi:MAG: alpha/beta fold hydrolase, partial [Pseudomonadota bacterium]